MKREPLLAVLVLAAAGLLAAAPGSSLPDGGPTSLPPDSLFRPLPVDSIAVLHYGRRRLRLRLSATAPDPCWHPDRAETERSDRSITVRLVGRRNPEEVCIQVLSPVHDTVEVRTGEPGAHTFSFWRSDSTSLDTTLTLPSDD